MPLNAAAKKHKTEMNHASLRAEAAPNDKKDATAHNLTQRCLAQSELMQVRRPYRNISVTI